MSNYDLTVIGGGSAGMAAALSAAEAGLKNILIIERNGYLGGILPQCIHDGFGLHLYQESLTGPEYAQRWIQKVQSDPRITIALNSTVISLAIPHRTARQAAADTQRSLVGHCSSPQRAGTSPVTIQALGTPLGGQASITTNAVVLATGCRERSSGQLMIPGDRPAGVYTAGEVQYLVNICNLKPGSNAVILGTGDIGLIAARRLSIEGINVKLVVGQKDTGLTRNHIQCIEDFQIPIRYGYTVVSIHGKGRLHGVTVAPLMSSGRPNSLKKEYIRANLLVVAAGLIPELELLDGCEPGPPIFVAGNASGSFNIVDKVTQDGIKVGHRAADYVLRQQGQAAYKLREKNQQLAKLQISEHQGLGSQTSPRFTSPAMPTGKGSRAKRKLLKNIKQCHITCIQCPIGCELTAVGEFIDKKPVCPESLTVIGAKCSKGQLFAIQETQSPHRTFTSTVKVNQAVSQGGDPFVSYGDVSFDLSANQVDCLVDSHSSNCSEGGDATSQNLSGESAGHTLDFATTCNTDNELNTSILLPVKTSQPVPLTAFKQIAKICAKTTIAPPIKPGDIIIPNVANTEASLIATAGLRAVNPADGASSLLPTV